MRGSVYGRGRGCGASSDLIRDLGLYRGVRESEDDARGSCTQGDLGLHGGVRESEDDARGSSTQGAIALRAHRVMI